MWETAVKKHDHEVFERAKKEDALKLIEKGMDNTFIHEITGLSRKEIQALRRKKR